MAGKRTPAAERQREHAGSKPPSSGAGPVITGRIPDTCRARKGADASQVSL
jgi:hypothetical protein